MRREFVPQDEVDEYEAGAFDPAPSRLEMPSWKWRLAFAILAAGIILVVATGCVQRQSAGEVCEGEGFTRGSQAFATCYASIIEGRAQWNAAATHSILSRPPQDRTLYSPGAYTK